MDQEAREEVGKLHERITRLRERVVNLEAQQPHINAALMRIEGSVKEMTAKLDKAKWAVLAPIIAILVGVAFKVILTNGIPGIN